LGKSSRAYKSAKRGKELLRQKKQEEKRLRRLAREKEAKSESDELTAEGEAPKPENTESQ